MLYRECRFQAAYELLQHAVPQITEAQAFQLFGGIGLELCPMNVGKTPFYLLTGGCTKLSFEVFFKIFQIEHTQLTVDEFITDCDFEANYYMIPICRSMLSKNEDNLSELEKSMTGHSYALIREIDVEQQRILLNDLNLIKEYQFMKQEGKDWVSINLCKRVFEESTSSFYPLKIHCINKEALKKNEYIQSLTNADVSMLVINNLENVLVNERSRIDYVSIKGIQAYEQLCGHLLHLQRLLHEDEDPNVEKYIRIQAVFLRFFVASGSDSCYRDELIHSLEQMKWKKDTKQDQLLQEWKETAVLWRKIGRLLGKMHVRFECSDFEQMVEYFFMVKDKEINLIQRTLNSLDRNVRI